MSQFYNMTLLIRIFLFLALIVFVLEGCTGRITHGIESPERHKARIANPASEYCVKSGGTLVIRKHVDGGEYGVCVFKDKGECEEWAYFRGECHP